MNLFEFNEIDNETTIEKIKKYIEEKKIKKVHLNLDYSNGIIENVYQEYPFLKDSSYQYQYRVYNKNGFNYKIWEFCNTSKTKDEFLAKVKQNLGDKVSNNCKFHLKDLSLKEFQKEWLNKPVALPVIEVNSIEEIEIIKNDIANFKSYLELNPSFITKREIKKICGIGNNPSDVVGNGIEVIFEGGKDD